MEYWRAFRRCFLRSHMFRSKQSSFLRDSVNQAIVIRLRLSFDATERDFPVSIKKKELTRWLSGIFEIFIWSRTGWSWWRMVPFLLQLFSHLQKEMLWFEWWMDLLGWRFRRSLFIFVINGWFRHVDSSFSFFWFLFREKICDLLYEALIARIGHLMTSITHLSYPNCELYNDLRVPGS